MGEIASGEQGALLDVPDLVTEIHELYRTTVPDRANSRLTGEQRKLIQKALDERSVEIVKQAIIGLAASDHHREGGFTALRYAIGKVKVSETVGDRIDMMAAKAPKIQHSTGLSSGQQVLMRFQDPAVREIVSGHMNTVRRALLQPSELSNRLAEESERWLRERARIVVTDRSDTQIEWGHAG